MKIGILGTIWINTPPPQYGGTEHVVYDLANGLVAKGHDVTLFAPQTAKTDAHLSPTVTFPLRDKHISWDDISYHLYHITQAFYQSKNFDILHVHINKYQDYLALPLASLSPTPVVTTIHFALPTPTYKHDRYVVLEKYKDLPYTSISKSQQKSIELNFIQNVYNSLDTEEFPFSSTPKGYLMWLGKIVPHKGTKEAILAAKMARIPIKIAGVVDADLEESIEYFEKEIKPLIDGKQVDYVGEVGMPEKAQLLGGAIALLNPILWNEPFGLVMAEAQAVGTPVIAFNKGSAKEIVKEGKTGFLVSSVEEMAEKIKDVRTLQREVCRSFTQETFSPSEMIHGYETAYSKTRENWELYQEKVAATQKQYVNKPAAV